MKQVKPLIKDYKAALSFLIKGKFDLKYTKSGALSGESVGYLKGYFDFTQNEKLSVQMSVADLVGLVLDHYNIPISTTDLALYFRNERDQIKNNDLRVHVVSAFHNAFERELAEQVIEESNSELEEDHPLESRVADKYGIDIHANQDESECDTEIHPWDKRIQEEGGLDEPQEFSPEDIQNFQNTIFSTPNFSLWGS